MHRGGVRRLTVLVSLGPELGLQGAGGNAVHQEARRTLDPQTSPVR